MGGRFASGGTHPSPGSESCRFIGVQPFPGMDQPWRAPEPPPGDANPVFEGRALPYALGGIAGAVAAARTASYLMRHLALPLVAYLVIFWTVVFAGLWLTCRYVSRRFGTGNPWRDFGFAWRPSDLWRGAVGFWVAISMSRFVRSPWAGHTDRLHRMSVGWTHVSSTSFAVFALSAIVAAPIFEELAFRGMLQRSMAGRFGQTRALVGQAGAFAAYHLFPGLGWENLPYALGLACFGLVAGWLARRLGRLGAGSTAHVFNNALSVLVIAGSR
jgi:membrane protease YdiL (CAAX protease family)